MRVHCNAKTTPKGRALIVQRVEVDGWSVRQTAAAFGVSARTVSKWRARYRGAGVTGLADRPSCPHRIRHRTSRRQEAAIVLLRQQRLVGAAIGRRLGVPRSTVGAVLRRAGLGRLPALTPPVPIRRYERAQPGELVHVDIKPLVRIERVGHRIHGDRTTRVTGAGWEYVHVCIDDASRVAYVEMLTTLDQDDASGFLERAVGWFVQHGVRVQRVMTDNGSAYRARRFAGLCERLGLRHLRTRPYTPRTNGKAERFIQTLLREWAYCRPYPTSNRRERALAPWLRYYNHRRPHTSLNYRAPITRLQQAVV
jgi:transposase InsO family protein